MNDATLAYWNSYVRQIADLFWLRDWEIEVTRGEPTLDNSAAENQVQWGGHYQEIRLGAEFWNYSPERQRGAIVHELMHIHTHGMHLVTDRFCKATDESEVATFFIALHMHELETTIDAVTRAIAGFFPLPLPPEPS